MSTDEPDPSDLPPAVRETLDSLGGALGDIAELDKEQLNETIGLLETLGHDKAAGILRSRREVLKGAGAATGLGIAGLAGATATGGARAQSDTQSGTIGNGNQDADLQDVSAESVSTERIGNGRLYAGAFDGTDADARLNNCLSAASEGDLIHLEKAAYSATRTISQQIGFIGQGIRFDNTTRLTGDWTLQNGEVYISRLRLQTSTLTVQGSDCMLTQLRSGDVVFKSGTSGCVIDSCVRVTITDNGSNTIGDVS